MSIYWERCSICGRHYPTRSCWLHPERSICPYCCLLCPEWDICPNKVWFPSIAKERRKGEVFVERAEKEARKEKKEKAKAILEELLKKLEEG